MLMFISKAMRNIVTFYTSRLVKSASAHNQEMMVVHDLGWEDQGRRRFCFFLSSLAKKEKASASFQMFVKSWESFTGESITIRHPEMKWRGGKHHIMQWHSGHMTKCGVSPGPGGATESTGRH